MPNLEALLRAGDPAPLIKEDDARNASVALAREITSPAALEPAPGRRRRRLTAALVALSVGVPTAAYATSRFLAQTGEHQTASTENDTSEVINVCAADFPEYVLSLPAPTDAPPAGLTWATIGRTVAQRLAANPECAPGGTGVVTFETAVKDAYYTYAESVFVCRAARDHEAGRNDSALANARGFATMMDRSEQLGVLSGDGWQAYRDAGRTGDWVLIKEFAAATGATPCP